MKTTTLSIDNTQVSRWYSEKPHAFRTREDMGKRMTLAMSLSATLYAIALCLYFLNTYNHEKTTQGIDQKKLVDIIIQTVEPPLPPDIRTGASEATDAKSIGQGIIENMREQKNLSTAEAREALKMALSIAIDDGLNNALDAINKQFGDDLPTPSLNASNAGLLSDLGDKIGSLVGLHEALGLTRYGLGSDLTELSNANSTNKIGKASSQRDLKGGKEYGTGLSRAKLRISARKQNLIVEKNLRPAEDILVVLDKHQPALQDLYSQFSSIGNGLATIQFMIAPDGVVSSARVVKKSFNNDSFERGLLSMIRRMRFSSIQTKASQSVEVPFNFSGDTI